MSKKVITALLAGVIIFFFSQVFGQESGLVGYWKFDEGKGSIVADSSGKKNGCKVQGAGWVKGKSGYGLLFDGKNDILYTTKPADFTEGITVAAWIKSERGGAVAGMGWHGKGRFWLILSRKTISWHHSFYYSEEGAAPKGFVEGTAFGREEVVNFNLPQDRWFHLMVIDNCKTGEIFFYVNGKLLEKKKREKMTIAPVKEEKITIGGLDCGNFPFQGVLDEVKIYNRALKEGEIKGERR